MITFKHFSDRTKSRLLRNILCCYISYLVILLNDPKNSFIFFSDKVRSFTAFMVKIIFRLKGKDIAQLIDYFGFHA